MGNFFRSLNRKGRRKFDSLKLEEKEQILSAEVNKKFSEVANRRISESFVNGVLSANYLLYKNYVKQLEECTDNEKGQEIIQEMLKDISIKAHKYKEKFEKKEEDNNASN